MLSVRPLSDLDQIEYSEIWKLDLRHIVAMPQVTWGTCQKVYEVLVPGSKYSSDKAAQLASIMRKFSDELLQQSQETRRRGPVLADDKKSQRDIDFSKYQKRHIAMDIAYQGFEYHGFARQDGINKTIEEELFSAMRKTRLIPSGMTWKELSYSRGGRTDKGVSAAGQVIALEVRSRALLGEGSISEEMEFDYPAILNKVLNPEIRVLGWKTVEPSFSARFSARSREYKYFFIEENRELDVPAMQKAATYLVGEHDFRNFCKADIPTVSNFVRKILSASLHRTSSLKLGNFTGVELHIEGTAFLWHQIRCIAAVLHAVGKGLEPPEVIRDLLDTKTNDRKPQYSMASEQPLLLNQCSYEGLCFNRSEQVASLVNKEMSMEISRLLSRALLLVRMRERVMNAPITNHSKTMDSKKPHNYIPLLKRMREPSIEERLLRYQHSS